MLLSLRGLRGGESVKCLRMRKAAPQSETTRPPVSLGPVLKALCWGNTCGILEEQECRAIHRHRTSQGPWEQSRKSKLQSSRRLGLVPSSCFKERFVGCLSSRRAAFGKFSYVDPWYRPLNLLWKSHDTRYLAQFNGFARQRGLGETGAIFAFHIAKLQGILFFWCYNHLDKDIHLKGEWDVNHYPPTQTAQSIYT